MKIEKRQRAHTHTPHLASAQQKDFMSFPMKKEMVYTILDYRYIKIDWYEEKNREQIFVKTDFSAVS